jgi:hypothetical protein
MNHPNWRLQFDRLDGGEDAAGWDELLDDLARDAGDRCDFDDALRRTFLHRTRAALREAHATARTRFLDALPVPGDEGGNDSPENTRREGLRIMVTRRGFFIITAAAAAVVFLATALWFGSGSRFDSHAAFAQMIENVRRANSVSFTEVEQVTSNIRATMKYAFVENPPRMRWEANMGGLSFTQVFDGSKTYAVFGWPLRMVRVGKMRPPDHVFEAAQQILETLRKHAKADTAEYLGRREVDGVNCHVYQFLLMEDDPNTSRNDWCKLEIYLSADALYPIKIVWLGYVGDPPRSEQKEPIACKTTFDFKWDFELDPAMFAVEVPKGWSVVQLPDDATQADLFPKLDPQAHRQATPPKPQE